MSHFGLTSTLAVACIVFSFSYRDAARAFSSDAPSPPSAANSCEAEIGFTALSERSVSRKISRIRRSRGFCQARLSFEFGAGKLVEEGYVDGIFVSRMMHMWGVISEGVLVLTLRGAKAGASVVIPAIRPAHPFDDALSLVDGRELPNSPIMRDPD